MQNLDTRPEDSDRRLWTRFLVLFLQPALYLLVATQIGCDFSTSARNQPEAVPARTVSQDPPQIARTVSYPVQIADVTASTGVRSTYSSGADSEQCSILESLGGGVGALDYDRDGRLDVLFPGGGKIAPGKITAVSSSLWRCTADWQFTNTTTNAHLESEAYYTHGIAAADFDNDGFTDVLMTGYGGLQLFHNQGDGTFVAVAQDAGLKDTLWSSSAGWADLNGDQCLDLYVCHYVDWSFANNPFCRGPNPGQRDVCPPKKFTALPHVLFFSNGDGTFQDATEFAGLKKDGKGLGVVLSDIDGDQDVDIYVANDTTENFLYLNDGSGRFEEVGTLHGVALDQHGGANGSMGVDVGDYNLDGRPDLWVTNFEHEAFALYENLGHSSFQHMSDTTGVSSIGGLFVGFGTVFADIDLDGDEDLIVTNGHVIKYPSSGVVQEKPVLLLNDSGKRYVRAPFPQDSFFSGLHRGRGLVVSDFDIDGDLDLAISHNDEPAALLRNDGPKTRQFLRVQLIGRNSNRDAIGAHLELKTSGKSQHRWVRGGASYLSQNDYFVHWGIPDHQTVQELRILWPSGQSQIVSPIELNKTLVVVEP